MSANACAAERIKLLNTLILRLLLQKQLISFVGSDLHGPGDLADMVRIFKANDLRLLGNQTLFNVSLADSETPVETPIVLYKD